MKERDIAINAGAILLLVALIEFFVPRRLIVMGIPLAILAVLIGYTNYLKYRWERQIFSQADSSPLERKILLWSGIGAPPRTALGRRLCRDFWGHGTNSYKCAS